MGENPTVPVASAHVTFLQLGHEPPRCNSDFVKDDDQPGHYMCEIGLEAGFDFSSITFKKQQEVRVRKIRGTFHKIQNVRREDVRCILSTWPPL